MFKPDNSLIGFSTDGNTTETSNGNCSIGNLSNFLLAFNPGFGATRATALAEAGIISLSTAKSTINAQESEAAEYNASYGKTPNGLYKKISEMKNSGDNNASINTANGPESTKCN